MSGAKNNDLEMKVASHLRTQAALKKSHESAMAELILSHRSKVDDLTSTHAFNLNAEKNNLRQRICSERKLQNAGRSSKMLANQLIQSTKKVAAQQLHRMKK